MTDTPKMIVETLCVAQSAIGASGDDRKMEHLGRLQRLINAQEPTDAEDLAPSKGFDPPETPGWYCYTGGRNTMVFLLTQQGKWYVALDNGTMSACDWEYIEQALMVWNLKLMLPLGGGSNG
jgi:hypothetical protein